MQDKTQVSDRAAEPIVQPNEASPGKRVEELTRLFQSLFDTTSEARGRASAGDFSGIREHLQRRRGILDRVQELMPDKGENGRSMNAEVKDRLRAILQSTQEENLLILQLINERKKDVLSKIVEVQNRRHVFNYLR